ncbi:MAG TPA: response regulator transcription factor [Pirellulales bacterium]|jgi:DNA-binding response OmpR family regulator|nr:response regulator transcription factor [Pirellulales bacterium]
MPHLLVVEDQAALRTSIARGLVEEGYQVTAVSNGLHAIAAAKHEPPDAMVLDIMLPGKGGLDLLRELRADGFTAPVLIITARDTIPDRVAGLDSGADDYLVKPFAFEELLARLRALLRRHGRTTLTTLVVGDLELDLIRRQAKRDGVCIDLKPREFELLAYLVRNANEIVTRDDIARDVWQETTATWSNVIEVHINRLRRKIELPGLKPMLQTVRGTGYVLKAGL